MCIFTNPSELCNHTECHHYYMTQGTIQMNDVNIIAGINSLIQQQCIALTNLVNKNSVLNQKIDEISKLVIKSPIQSTISDEKFNLEGIFQWISSSNNFTMAIALESVLPQVIFKEKGFDLLATVKYLNGEKAFLPTSCSFIIALFTMENPPKLLKTNISGRKILRGTSETVPDGNGNIHFRNVVINEVTSHYPNDSFCLVIMCPSISYIKPIATSGISVRARKHKRE